LQNTQNVGLQLALFANFVHICIMGVKILQLAADFGKVIRPLMTLLRANGFREEWRNT